jgi:peptide subunit release factor RF-3
MDAVRSGALTPMFFGSAMSNFGVQLFLDTFIGLASPPGAASRPVRASAAAALVDSSARPGLAVLSRPPRSIV